MKKIICKKEYDTENAELLKKHTEGVFGEPNSPYPKEDIKRLSKDKAEEWLAKH